MKGFDAEFTDLEHYIRVITERIWEGRRIDDIERYYSSDCAVETPGSVSVGIAPVIQSTRDTLAIFPDRELLAEDVLWSGDEEGGFLSSHRILSPMTHLGAGPFGPPSGRRLYARTIADCVCKDNRIVHEWLVRDQAAIARQIGLHERELAQSWLAERGPIRKPAMPPAPQGYQSHVAGSALALRYRDLYLGLWKTGVLTSLQNDYDRAITLAAPGGQTLHGHTDVQNFWAQLLLPFSQAEISIEHLTENHRPERCAAVAMRWRVQALHTGAGRYGPPTGKPIEILGISHAEFVDGRIVREWLLIDDVALWMQILAPHS